MRRDAIVGSAIGASPTTPRLRLDHDERREQILAAARRLFSERPPGEVSATEVAREAGVARGLLHHYFGTKRDLYREVVRSMLRFPPVPAEDTETAIERWLTMVSRNRAAFFAAVGAQGPGHDPEIEALVEAGREEAVERLIANLGVPPTRELRAALRAYSAFAETAAAEWLLRRRLTRAQVHGLLLSTLTLIKGAP